MLFFPLRFSNKKMDFASLSIVIPLVVVPSVMAQKEETTLDFVTSLSAIFFTIVSGGANLLRTDDSLSFVKRLLNLADVSDAVTSPVQSSSLIGAIWNDPYVRVVTGLTVLGLAVQIFGTPYGYIAERRRKRNSILSTW